MPLRRPGLMSCAKKGSQKTGTLLTYSTTGQATITSWFTSLISPAWNR